MLYRLSYGRRSEGKLWYPDEEGGSIPSDSGHGMERQSRYPLPFTLLFWKAPNQ